MRPLFWVGMGLVAWGAFWAFIEGVRFVLYFPP